MAAQRGAEYFSGDCKYCAMLSGRAARTEKKAKRYQTDMQDTTTTTNPTEERELSHNVQDVIDWYTSEMIDYIRDFPFASIPQVLRKMVEAGPCPSRKDIAHLSWGPSIFRDAVRRMEALRWAAVA